jgi:hypothetical protein
MNTTLRIKMVLPAPARAGGSTQPQDFLHMRAQQRAAKARARRWRRGGLALGAVAGLALGALLFSRAEKPAGATVKRPASAQVAAASAPAASSAALVTTPGPATAPASATTAADPAPAVEAAPPGAAVATAEQGATSPTCEEDFARGDWKAAIDSCTRAFEATPTPHNALRTAHAYWSHGDAPHAGTWADRAVELGTDDADAFVLQGHSARAAGDSKGAIDAYRHYLHAAPRGWHAARVRQALRELRPRS